MEIKTLYRYEREPGKITVSTEKPDCEYEERYRVISSVGMLVTNNGIDLHSAIDTNTKNGWYEVVDETKDMDLKHNLGV